MEHSTTISTIGGTLLSIITISSTTVVSTIIVAAIGAITSFFVSLACKRIYNYFKHKKGE